MAALGATPLATLGPTICGLESCRLVCLYIKNFFLEKRRFQYLDPHMTQGLVIFLIVAISSVCGDKICRRGEWRAFDIARGPVCSTCLPDHACDGTTMRPCAAGTRALVIGQSECCSTNITCAAGAVGKGCFCQPLRGPLVQAPNGDYDPAEQDCQCPMAREDKWVFVQTHGCQCVLGKKCTGQLWERGDGGYRCFALPLSA